MRVSKEIPTGKVVFRVNQSPCDGCTSRRGRVSARLCGYDSGGGGPPYYADASGCYSRLQKSGAVSLPFGSSDTETRYASSDRECLAIIRCLGEVQWLVVGNPHPVMVYTDFHALFKNFHKRKSPYKLIFSPFE